jgi:circadian clock protein KaiB
MAAGGQMRDLDASIRFERAPTDQVQAEIVLHLYVAGTNARSLRAVERVSRLCEAHLSGRYRLDVVDIYQDPGAAEREQVIAAPTLVRSLPTPRRYVVGDMADEGRLLATLGVEVAA